MNVRVLQVSQERLAAFCKRHHIRKLALFGSALRADFTEDSDLDVLIEFEEGYPIGLLGFSRIERELSELAGRKVDLNTPGFLSKYYRDRVLREAQVHYDAT